MVVPASVEAALKDWQTACALDQGAVEAVYSALADRSFGTPCALDQGTLSTDWLDALRGAGVPFYGQPDYSAELLTCGVASNESVATIVGDQLELSSLLALRGASGLDLKPVRAWVGQHFEWRPQLAPGVWLVVSDLMALLLSTRNIVLGGFLHYGHERRYSVTLKPYGFQLFEL